MNDYNIYALKVSTDWRQAVYDSLHDGVGRFGWSYIKTANLHSLKTKIETNGWSSLSDEEQNCYQGFLLNIKEDDYVVYINVPEYGKCTLARVTKPYYFEYSDEEFNHRFGVDPSSILTFDRNSDSVHPSLSARLKLQGRYWRIYLREEFEALVQCLSKGTAAKSRTLSSSLGFLIREIQPSLSEITTKIHRTHPNYQLEELIAEIFRHVPGVRDVKWQGGAGDHGADILVTFESGIPVSGLQQQRTCVVQVKSFEGEHWDTKAVEDINRAFEHYPEAEIGLIISTACSSTDALDTAIEKLRETTKKTVSLLIGSDVAAFVLRFGSHLLA